MSDDRIVNLIVCRDPPNITDEEILEVLGNCQAVLNPLSGGFLRRQSKLNERYLEMVRDKLRDAIERIANRP